MSSLRETVGGGWRYAALALVSALMTWCCSGLQMGGEPSPVSVVSQPGALGPGSVGCVRVRSVQRGVSLYLCHDPAGGPGVDQAPIPEPGASAAPVIDLDAEGAEVALRDLGFNLQELQELGVIPSPVVELQTGIALQELRSGEGAEGEQEHADSARRGEVRPGAARFRSGQLLPLR